MPADQASSSSPHLTPIDALDFVERDIPERRLILGAWLPEKGLVMIHAYRGTGKTRFAMSAGYAIASGLDWLGFTVEKPRKVLYVDGEMSASEMKRLLQEIMNGSPRKPEAGYFRILSADLEERGIPDLSERLGRGVLEQTFGDADVVVLDNISCLLRSGKENESESWQDFQPWLLDERRQGRAILFLHHTGKGGKQRGTSKREDVLDAVVKLERPEDYTADQGARFTVTFEKARGFTGPDASPFMATMSTVSGRAVWERGPIDQRDSALKLIREGMSVRRAAAECGVSKSKVERWKQEEQGRAGATAVPLSH